MDEINLLFKTLKRIDKGVMIDVGAHYGGSFARFVENGWLIYAFEPDDKNRKQLEKQYGSLSNVVVDERAVSNEKSGDVSFYRSEISSGISGLADFHSSHELSKKVGTITLKDYVSKQSIRDVDFLKVDTEGHDLFVLKGFP